MRNRVFYLAAVLNGWQAFWVAVGQVVREQAGLSEAKGGARNPSVLCADAREWAQRRRRGCRRRRHRTRPPAIPPRGRMRWRMGAAGVVDHRQAPRPLLRRGPCRSRPACLRRSLDVVGP